MATKFPTPNLDAVFAETEFRSAEEWKVRVALAVQADTTLAVESARVTVPENIRRYLLAVTAPPSEQSEVEDDRPPILKASHTWLESLAVAPKTPPVCEACGDSGMVNDYVEFGSTSVAMPVGCTVCHGYVKPGNTLPCDSCSQDNDMGICAGKVVDGSCPCWKARS